MVEKAGVGSVPLASDWLVIAGRKSEWFATAWLPVSCDGGSMTRHSVLNCCYYCLKTSYCSDE